MKCSIIDEFENKKIMDIPKIELSGVKRRELNPLVNGKRIKIIILKNV